MSVISYRLKKVKETDSGEIATLAGGQLSVVGFQFSVVPFNGKLQTLNPEPLILNLERP